MLELHVQYFVYVRMVCICIRRCVCVLAGLLCICVRMYVCIKLVN